MRMFLSSAVMVVAVLLVACGDDNGTKATGTPNGEILHLRGYNITPANYRSAMRAVLDGQDSTSFCLGIKSLTPAQVVDASRVVGAIEALPRTSPTSGPLPNATPVAGQAAQRADEEKAAQIILEECAR